MNYEDLELTEEEQKLLATLASVKEKLDQRTLSRYSRINPFAENLIDWHEKGERFAKEGTVIYDSATLIGNPSIGAHCWIGEGCMVDGSGGLEIGDYVVLSCGVHIYTHDTVKWALSGGAAEYKRAPVRVGNCVFVGAQSVITCGVTIGDHVLVGANATVVQDVPSYTIVAGTPAKPIGRVVVENGEVSYEYDTESQ